MRDGNGDRGSGAFVRGTSSALLNGGGPQQIIGGMRGVNGLLTETSLLDAEHGIKFRGLSIPEMNERLPNREGHHQPMTEAVLWLLMTGNVPSLDQCELVCDDLHARARNLPRHVVDAIDRYPKEMHPMTQLSSAVLAMQTTSKFAAAYAKGAPKTELWTYALGENRPARASSLC